MEYLRDAKARIDEACGLIKRAIGVGKLSTIERDIILDKLAKAYEMVLTAKSPELEPTAKKEIKGEVLPEAKVQSNIEFQADVSGEKPLAETVKGQKTEIVESDIETTKPAQPEVNREKVIKVNQNTEADQGREQQDRNQTEIIAEKYQGKQKSLNEIMGEQSGRVDVSTKLQNKPIADLARAIGINDKFIFIKELFDGDSAKYSETVNQLNSFSDLNDAIIFLQDNFQWSEDSESAAKFIDLVRRKFI